jgi:hypothetical protein
MLPYPAQQALSGAMLLGQTGCRAYVTCMIALARDANGAPLRVFHSRSLLGHSR